MTLSWPLSLTKGGEASAVRMRGWFLRPHPLSVTRCSGVSGRRWEKDHGWEGGRDAETNKTEDAQPFNLGMTDEVVQFPLFGLSVCKSLV